MYGILWIKFVVLNFKL